MVEVRHHRASDGVNLAYRSVGDGPAVVLLHGFLVDGDLNWLQSGVVDRIVGCGYRAIVPDARGHGASDKPHATQAYSTDRLVRDVIELVTEIEVDAFDLVGYSMGADTAARLAAVTGQVRSLVLGGVGGNLGDPPSLDRRSVATAIRAGVDGTAGQHELAELAGLLDADRHAAAALFEGVGFLTEPRYEDTHCPVLVIAGDHDTMAGGAPADLASRYRRSRSASIPDQDHLGAVFDPRFATLIVDFLADRSTSNGSDGAEYI